jgi:hypothetical protein
MFGAEPAMFMGGMPLPNSSSSATARSGDVYASQSSGFSQGSWNIVYGDDSSPAAPKNIMLYVLIAAVVILGGKQWKK